MEITRHHVWGGVLIALAFLTVLGYWALFFPTTQLAIEARIPAKRVADYMHAIIQANRTVYKNNVVERMQKKGIVHAAQHWKKEGVLPLPDQLVLDSGRFVAANGITYRLASLNPINEANNAQSKFEREGLEAVSGNTAQPYAGIVSLAQKRHLKAIYPDLAVSQDCVTCHNEHPESLKKDYKLGDALGGMIITIPLGRED